MLLSCMYLVTISYNCILLYIMLNLSSCSSFNQFVSAILSVLHSFFKSVTLLFLVCHTLIFKCVTLLFLVCHSLFCFHFIFFDLLKFGSNNSNNHLSTISQVNLYLTASHKIFNISSISLLLAWFISSLGMLTIFLMVLIR